MSTGSHFVRCKVALIQAMTELGLARGRALEELIVEAMELYHPVRSAQPVPSGPKVAVRLAGAPPSVSATGPRPAPPVPWTPPPGQEKQSFALSCPDELWASFDRLSRELECTTDYLINESMRHYLERSLAR